MKLIDEVINDLEENRDFWLEQVIFWGEMRDWWRKHNATDEAAKAQKYRLDAMDEALYYAEKVNEYKGIKD